MTQEEMLTKIMQAVSGMQDEISNINKRFDKVETDLSGVKEDTQRTREIVTRMELEHGQKLGALFDANSMNYDKIKEEITPILEKHDDDIEKLKVHVS